MISCEDGTVRIIDAQSYATLASRHTSQSQKHHFLNSGEYVISTEFDAEPVLWAARSGTIFSAFRLHEGDKLLMSPDGSCLIVYNSSVTLYKFPSAGLIFSISNLEPISASFGYNSKVVIVRTTEAVHILDSETGASQKPISTQLLRRAGMFIEWDFGPVLTANPKLPRFATWSRDEQLTIWDYEQGIRLAKYIVGQDVRSIRYNSFGTDLLIGSGGRYMGTSSPSESDFYLLLTEDSSERPSEIKVNNLNNARVDFDSSGKKLIVIEENRIQFFSKGRQGLFKSAEAQVYRDWLTDATVRPSKPEIAFVSKLGLGHVWEIDTSKLGRYRTITIPDVREAFDPQRH